jgi:hypothetical protein
MQFLLGSKITVVDESLQCTNRLFSVTDKMLFLGSRGCLEGNIVVGSVTSYLVIVHDGRLLCTFVMCDSLQNLLF